jgi:hypothetical protein
VSTGVSDQPPAVDQPAPAPIACPRCGAEVRGDQGWCLDCGLAARTRMAPAPDWRAPTLVAGGIGLAAIVALIVAFVVFTGHNQPVAPASTAPVTPTPAELDTTTVPVTTVPGATAPPATTSSTTTPPAATTAPPPATTATTP